MKLRVTYNAPVVLTFSILSIALFLLNEVYPVYDFIVLNGFNFRQTLKYPPLLLYTLAHSSAAHLMANLSLLLLIGPIVEEKYGWRQTLIMLLITALVTAILHLIFFNSGLMGASGIVFMLIILASFTSSQKVEIPVTFILILVIWLGKEIWESFETDRVSQFAHIIGGVCGSLFGFFRWFR